MIDIPEEIHTLLTRWARWCRGRHAPSSHWVKAGSLESSYLPPAGDVFESTEDAIKKSLGSSQERLSDHEAMGVEITVLRLPERNRMALRLHYVAFKAIPVAQKQRMLGVSYDDYFDLVRRSALMVRNASY